MAWQIRAAIRHHGSRLYIVDSREPGSAAQGAGLRADCRGARGGRAREAVAPGRRARGCAGVRTGPAASCVARRAGRRKRSGGAVRRGDSRLRARSAAPICAGARRGGQAHAVHGAGRLCQFARRRGHGTAARPLAGLRVRSQTRSARSFTANSGARTLPEGRGLERAPCWMRAVAGKLKALYVVGANPAKMPATSCGSRASRQARAADRAGPVSFRNRAPGRYRPAGASGIRKRRHHDQYRRRNSTGAQGRRFHGAALAISTFCASFRTNWRATAWASPSACARRTRRSTKFAGNVPGYDVSWTGLLTGAAEADAADDGLERPSACRRCRRRDLFQRRFPVHQRQPDAATAA